MLSEFRPPPGIVHDGTAYSSKGFWQDCDKVRWRGGYPERIGGWARLSTTTFLGTCRHLIQWTDLSAVNHIGLGTNLKYYFLTPYGGTLSDVTPIRRTVTLALNPFATTLGSATVTVTDTGHGALANDFTTFSGATAVNGITINGEYQIATVIDANTYTITAGNTASGTGAGGGTPSANYQINTGSADYSSGIGWGSGGWGQAGWGWSPAANTQKIRLWSADNFGEDLIFNPRGGGIYYYDTSVAPARAVNLNTITGASDTPTIANLAMVYQDAQRVVAFGCNAVGSAIQDPLLVRWSNDDDPANFTAGPTTTAGELRVPTGSYIVTAAKTRGRTLIWTDSSLYSMQFVETFVYGLQMLSTNIDIVSPQSVATVDEMAMWMGRENFMMYDGTVRAMPCSVREYVFSDINLAQAWKIYASTNRIFREVWWFYPSANSNCAATRYGPMLKIIRQLFTEANNEVYDIKRVLAGAGGLSLLSASLALVVGFFVNGAKLDIIGIGTAWGALLTASGGAIMMGKGGESRRPPDGEPPDDSQPS